MPRFDGTGPRGDGPMTGRGEGYCILELPQPDRPVRGYAGLAGMLVRGETQATRWPPTRICPVVAFRRGRSWAARRGRGRRLLTW
jgi:hypothetical protein